MKLFIGIFYLSALTLSLPSLAASFETNAIDKKNTTECKIIDLSFKWQKRKKSAFATAINVEPNTLITSNCLRFINIGDAPIELYTEHQLLASKNQQAFSSFPITISENDSLVLKTHSAKYYQKNSYFSLNIVETAPSAVNKNTGSIFWNIQTKLKSRKPKVWLVGPNSEHKNINAIVAMLAPGDKILLEGNATYSGVDIRGVSGTSSKPIQLIGVAVKGKRPIITGAGSKYNWALSLRNSHHWRISNLELTQAGICYRHESAFVSITKTLMHQCGNGILGTDFHSGSLALSHIEVRDSGGKEENRNWKHGIYMSTDRDRFPGSIFSISKSFLHNNRGNAIKSRAERAEIYNNWIENSNLRQSIYALELIGYEEYEPLPAINHDVVGNVILIRSKNYAIRVGGDNTGSSDGASRFASNLFLFQQPYQRHIFRLNGRLKSLNINDNLFLNLQTFDTRVNLIKDYIPKQNWYYAKPRINISGNYLSFKHSVYRSEYHGLYNRHLEEFSDIVVSNNKDIAQSQIKRFVSQENITDYTFNFLERIASQLANIPSPYHFKTIDNMEIHNRPLPDSIPFYSF